MKVYRQGHRIYAEAENLNVSSDDLEFVHTRALFYPAVVQFLKDEEVSLRNAEVTKLAGVLEAARHAWYRDEGFSEAYLYEAYANAALEYFEEKNK